MRLTLSDSMSGALGDSCRILGRSGRGGSAGSCREAQEQTRSSRAGLTPLSASSGSFLQEENSPRKPRLELNPPQKWLLGSLRTVKRGTRRGEGALGHPIVPRLITSRPGARSPGCRTGGPCLAPLLGTSPGLFVCLDPEGRLLLSSLVNPGICGMPVTPGAAGAGSDTELSVGIPGRVHRGTAPHMKG